MSTSPVKAKTTLLKGGGTNHVSNGNPKGWFKKGHDPRRQVGGGVVGTRNKILKDQLARIEQPEYVSPVEFALALMMRDTAKLTKWNVPLEEVTLQIRQRALESVFPYTCRRLPQQIDVTGVGKAVTFTPEILARMTDDEVQTLLGLVDRAALLANDTGDVVDVESKQVEMEPNP